MGDPMEHINEIEDGLFLSSRLIAETEDVLAAKRITHVLTIDTWPIRQKAFTRPENYVFQYLCKDDDENVDLLSHFEECNEFIRGGKRVLVHCYVGVSRSATIVIAYLMSKHRIPFEEALTRVNEKREVYPNDGFVDQLKLYEKMGFSVDKENLGYRLLYLTSITSQVGSFLGASNLPAEDQQKLESLLTVSGDLDILCRHCRHPLTSSKLILAHKYRENMTWRTVSRMKDGTADIQRHADCSEEFLVPSARIMAQCPGVAGKIYCPKCANKLGRFAWLGVYCDCGSKVQPGFVLSISKIDRKIPPQPPQVVEVEHL